MDRIDRLYRKALKGIESKNTLDRISETVKELAEWHRICTAAYCEGRDLHMCDQDSYRDFITEMEKEYG